MIFPKNRFGLLAAILLLFSSQLLWGQSHNLSVYLVDAATEEPVGFATASLTAPGAKTPAKYALSDVEGKAVLEKVKAGKYVFKAEILGYKTFTKEVEVTTETVSLGTFRLETDQQVLDAASVSATGNNAVDIASLLNNESSTLIPLETSVPTESSSTEGEGGKDDEESRDTVTEVINYTIEEGDSWSVIIQQFYGEFDMDLIYALCDYNNMAIDDVIYPGLEIKIPPESDLR